MLTAFDPGSQSENPDYKIYASLEKIGEVIRKLQWEKAKTHGLSPLQLQSLIYIKHQPVRLRKAAALADEFLVTRPTISDTIKALIQKGLILKEIDPEDTRSTYLHLSAKGEKLINELENYPEILINEVTQLSESDKGTMINGLLNLIFKMNLRGVITPPRMCYSCNFYEGDFHKKHFCNLLKTDLKNEELRLDCPEHELKPV